jgi:hypothetical protein
MAKLNDAFPSKYMTAADFEDGDVTATIISAEVEMIGQGADASQKIILGLKGIKKPIVVNRTNANTIAKVTGSDDTDDWIGKRITIGASEVEFKGDLVMSIRVRLKKPAPVAAKAIVENPDADEAMPSADEF